VRRLVAGEGRIGEVRLAAGRAAQYNGARRTGTAFAVDAPGATRLNSRALGTS
jgi:hypothetical protein